jgi:hypothetical protein
LLEFVEFLEFVGFFEFVEFAKGGDSLRLIETETPVERGGD